LPQLLTPQLFAPQSLASEFLATHLFNTPRALRRDLTFISLSLTLRLSTLAVIFALLRSMVAIPRHSLLRHCRD